MVTTEFNFIDTYFSIKEDGKYVDKNVITLEINDRDELLP